MPSKYGLGGRLVKELRACREVSPVDSLATRPQRVSLYCIIYNRKPIHSLGHTAYLFLLFSVYDCYMRILWGYRFSSENCGIPHCLLSVRNSISESGAASGLTHGVNLIINVNTGAGFVQYVNHTSCCHASSSALWYDGLDGFVEFYTNADSIPNI